MVDLSDRWSVFSFCDPTAGAGAVVPVVAAVASTMVGSGNGGGLRPPSSSLSVEAAALLVAEDGLTTRGIIFRVGTTLVHSSTCM